MTAKIFHSTQNNTSAVLSKNIFSTKILPRSCVSAVPLNLCHFPLTDIDDIYVNGIGKCASHRVGSHNGDVVVHPDGRHILAEEARVLAGRFVVRTLEHLLRAVEEKENIMQLCDFRHCAVKYQEQGVLFAVQFL